MSQENEYNEAEVIEDDILDEVEENEEVSEEDGSDNSETITELRAKIAKMESAIVKSKQKSKKSKSVSKQPKTDKFDSQVDLLRFNGVTSEEIEKLKKIAVMEDIDLIDARNSDYFKMYKEKADATERSRQASVSTSNRGKQTANNKERIAKRIATSDKWSKDDIKSFVHGK